MTMAENIDTDRRQSERLPLMIDGEISIGTDAHACEIFDISERGAKIRIKDVEAGAKIAASDEVVLTISRFGGFGGEIAWTDENFVGMRFVENHKAMIGLILEDADQTRNGN